MYENFYNFSEKPFSLLPDPAFLYLGSKHSTGLTMLQYGLANRLGISVLTGEIGSGKTTLIRKLLDEIGEDLTVGLISNAHESFGTLIHWVSLSFGLPFNDEPVPILFDRFREFLIDQYAKGQRTLLIIDEAQNLDATSIEELRLLTNINADKDLVLQLVLVGQPELRVTLRAPELRQFFQRIGVDYHLPPLAADETDSYIVHRLTTAGGDENIFVPLARRMIHYQCGGIPRLINSMCDTALVYAFAEGAARISGKLVYNMALERIKGGLFGAGMTAETVDLDFPDRGQEILKVNFARAKVDLKITGSRSKIARAANT